MHRLVTACFILCVCCATPSASAAGPGAGQDAARKRVDDLVEKWLKPPGADRRAAEIALQTSIPSKDLAYLEAATGRNDLSDEARTWLKAFVERERPREAARLKRQERFDVWNDWNGAAVDLYDKFGHHDPKWDDAAREAVRVFVAAPPNHAKAYELLGKAVALGCDDALVAYFYGRQMETFASREKADEQLQAAAIAMASSNYPASRKEFAELKALEHYESLVVDSYRRGAPLKPEEFKPKLQAMTVAFGKTWHEMAAEPGVAEKGLEDIATRIVELHMWPEMDRQPYFDEIYPSLEKALPKSAVPLIVKGKFYVKYAWDARGAGFAQTVTAEGWRLFFARLAEAQKAFEQAWAIDPTRSEVADSMLTVALGLQWPRDQMEVWFDRAMKANPDDAEACAAKLYYLEPKWYGSAKEMVDFGHECLAGGNWSGKIPWVLLNAHRALAVYTGDADEYWSQPQVWADLQSLFVPVEAAYPADWYDRSCYCYYACRSGHWDVAAREFQALGDHAQPTAFGGVEKMNRFRASASEKSGVPLEPLK